MAQLGSALVWGTRGRGFKSRQPDSCDVGLEPNRTEAFGELIQGDPA